MAIEFHVDHIDEAESTVTVQAALLEIVKIIYNIGVRYIPGFVVFLPFDVMLSIIRSVHATLGHDIKVDLQNPDWWQLLRFLKEAAEAAANPTSAKERGEAIYALLVYVTNIEAYLSEEEFMAATGDAVAMLPVDTKVSAV